LPKLKRSPPYALSHLRNFAQLYQLVGDVLIGELMLMPNSVENATATGKTKTQDPGEVPH